MNHRTAGRRGKSKLSHWPLWTVAAAAMDVSEKSYAWISIHSDEAANDSTETAIYTVIYALMTTLIIPVHVHPVLYCVCVFFCVFVCVCVFKFRRGAHFRMKETARVPGILETLAPTSIGGRQCLEASLRKRVYPRCFMSRRSRSPRKNRDDTMTIWVIFKYYIYALFPLKSM